MKLNSEIMMEDMEYINSVDFISWDLFREKTIFVTGATGLIGFSLINALLYVNKEKNLNLHIIALVRDLQKAKNRFENQLQTNKETLTFVIGDVRNLPEVTKPLDFIIHGASQTASREFVSHPVETIDTTLMGTKNMLELACDKHVKSMVYLSSMEVYGYPQKGHKVGEDEIGAMSPLNIRNSYPISKQMSENLCCSYSSEYGTPVKIARLTQTFGPGVNYNDQRIFAEFGRCILEKKDIVLRTKGETERCYLYTADAVTAILKILLDGESGTAYNVADESTYCSIAEMAEKVAGEAGINVRYELQDEKKNGYPSTLYMDLDTTRLKKLGWTVGGGIIYG